MSPVRVDFYLLEDPSPEGRWQVICRLIEKAWLRKHQVFVFCDTEADAETLDEALWTFKPQSFIPHNLQGEGPDYPPPVQIGLAEPRGFNDILVNLSAGIPAFYGRFQRVIEIISGKEAAREAGRARYRGYRTAGCALQTHTLSQEGVKG
ncbi:DNA polymerase III subunit chi [Legionella geestiana]|uniref:DNA polymerase III subunit chi n=1 Tax=Legionella geestiana TaxID=45065 RepID=UPI0010931F74|nr:DNA polymerase III subunit chi [Legionella geestiana]QDQ39106.1 DNA polymerase III subunit chi [Legionella geestiana]